MTRFLVWSGSIIFHMVLVLRISTPAPPAPTLQTAPVEVEVAREATPEPSRLASTEDAGNRAAPKKTDFYSSHNQTVSKQSRARAGEQFQSGKSPGSSSGLTLSDLGISSRQQLGTGDGTFEGQNSLSAATDESLADIELGQRTLLNAKEYSHWLYFQRIKGLLGPIWRLDIDDKMRSMQMSGRKLAKSESVTQVVVILDKSGAIRKVTVTQSSGSEMLDNSAIEAFRAASPFPNPPTALHRADGTVSIRWTFIVNQKATRITYSHEKSGPPTRYMP